MNTSLKTPITNSATFGSLLALGPATLSVPISLSATRVGGRIKTSHCLSEELHGSRELLQVARKQIPARRLNCKKAAFHLWVLGAVGLATLRATWSTTTEFRFRMQAISPFLLEWLHGLNVTLITFAFI
jgi:hypothetical protein